MEKWGDEFFTFFPNYSKVSLDKFNQMEGEKPHTQPSKSTQGGRRPQGRKLEPPTEGEKQQRQMRHLIVDQREAAQSKRKVVAQQISSMRSSN